MEHNLCGTKKNKVQKVAPNLHTLSSSEIEKKSHKICGSQRKLFKKIETLERITYAQRERFICSVE